MTSHYFIGIGGSGAKSLEAFIHLCAAGLGPAKAWVGLVDQDAANGHVAQTRQLIEAYTALRARLRPTGNDKLAPGTRFLHTEIVTAKEDLLWQPEPRQGATLGGQVFGPATLTDEQAQLLGCLFTPEELALPLDEGFRGRPAIGAATFLRMESQSAFWRNLTDEITRAAAGGGGDIRVFLAGSICGGTGAAGFPTLARMLNTDFGQNRVKIGGALLLPYFQFPSSTVPTEIVAESAGFLEQTAKALKYYYSLLKDDPVFADLYLIGWNPLLATTDLPEKGGDRQRNPPLAPELLAALAASRFMLTAPGNGRLRYLARRSGQALSWADLPAVTDLPPNAEGGGQIRTAIGTLVRFAYAFNYVYAPLLIGPTWRRSQSDPWFRKQVSDFVGDAGDPAVQTLLAELRQFCRRTLGYFAEMSYAMHRGKTRLDLIRAPQYAAGPSDRGGWQGALHDAKAAHPEFPLLIASEQDNRDPSMSDVLNILSHQTTGPAPGRDIGVLCSTLYHACSVR